MTAAASGGVVGRGGLFARVGVVVWGGGYD